VDVRDDANVLGGWWHSDGPNDGTNGNSQPDPYTVTVTGGQTNNTGDFGYFSAGAAVGNRVWLDNDASETQTAGDAGLGGARIRLTAAYPNGTTTTVYAVSAADGSYSFGNLLLDESGSASVPPGTTGPTYVLSVGRSPPGAPYSVPRNQGGPKVDSDRYLGVTAEVLRGQTGVNLLASPGDEGTQASYDFGFSAVPTLVVISSVRAFTRGGEAFVQWETAAELDAVGFFLERRDAAGNWLLVTPEIVPATGEAPAVYEAPDAAVRSGETHTWRILELDGRGRLLTYGPYTLTVDGAGVSYEEWVSAAFGDRAGDRSRGADPDGDGLTNFEEYLAGTDPLNRNSLLAVTAVRDNGGDGIALTWRSAPDRRYAIEVSTDLRKFLPVARDIPGVPPVNVHTVRVDKAVSPIYFRVIAR
jgi:hypothetical protein